MHVFHEIPDAVNSATLFTALFGILNPGDEVIVPTPAFPLYETIATTAGAKVVELDLKKTNFQIDKTALEAAISPKTRCSTQQFPKRATL